MTAPSAHYDVVVVGGGHNGLTAAAYLAQAGRRVAVFEQRSIIGGFCTTEENVLEAPGFKMNPFAADHVMTNIPPRVDDQLDLAREGLRWISPDPFYSYVHPGGASILFWRSRERTAASIARISPADARQYLAFTEAMTALWRVAHPYLQGHPRRIAPRALIRMLKGAALSRRALMVATRVLLSSPGAVIEEWFESDEVKAALACFAVATMAGLDEPGSGIILSMMAVQHEWGIRRPVGGNGAFTQALADSVTRHGGQVFAGRGVQRVQVSGGRSTGVELSDGTTVGADTVVVTTDPWTLAHRLLPEGELPEQTYRELRGMSVLSTNVSTFKADIALAGRPDFSRYGTNAEHLPGTVVLMAPSLDYVRDSTRASLAGDLARQIPVWFMLPSATDRTLVPPDSPGEAAYVYLPTVPYELRDGRKWSDASAGYLTDILGIVDDHLPGTSDLVIGSHTTTPQDFEELSGLHRGHIFHVDMTLAQFGPWRPVPSMSGWRSGVDHLWHAGAGSHPMGTLSGWPGRSVAREILKHR